MVEALSLRLGAKTRMSTPTICIQRHTKSSSKGKKARRKKEKHIDWKMKYKTVLIHRWHDCVQNPEECIFKKSKN